MHQPTSTTHRKQTLPHIVCAVALVFSITLAPISAYATEPTDTNTGDQATTQAPAEPTPPTPANPTPPEPPAQTGPTAPTGADSKTYVENEDGTWENDQYIWDPTTGQTRPKQPVNYSYNPATGKWDDDQWRYDPVQGRYVENKVSTSNPPAGTSSQSSNGQTGNNSAASNSRQPGAANAQNNGVTGPNSDNKVDANQQHNGIFDLFYNASISNSLSSTALTGDALVAGNTLAGNALTGSALAIANFINMMQSSWDYMANGGLQTFMANMYGDVYGDLMLDPSQIQARAQNSGNGDVNVNGNASINNDIDLDAQSGDATVTGNTQAGDATSGDAHVMANLINSISSSISSGRSFLGMLNIFGNFNGDVLFPAEMMNLLQNQPDAVATITLPAGSTHTNTTQTITNNINANANSGTAGVENNTNAGNATSGTAETRVNILNLTGRQIVGQNAMLVFVNVFGNWVGLIVDAPAGTRAAAIGDSSSQSTQTNDLTTNENQTITNNLDLDATSGDASVNNNSSAGSATSGDVSATANIVNIANSNLSFSDWFGVLFINVFGDWYGSVGVDTDAGNPIPEQTAGPAPEPAVAVASVISNATETVTTFTQHFSNVTNVMNTETNSEEDAAQSSSSVLSLSSDSDGKSNSQTMPNVNDPNFLFSIIGTVLGMSILGGERVLAHRKRNG